MELLIAVWIACAVLTAGHYYSYDLAVYGIQDKGIELAACVLFSIFGPISLAVAIFESWKGGYGFLEYGWFGLLKDESHEQE